MSAKSFCAPTPQTFCVYASSNVNGNVIFTIYSSASGWAGIGIGSQMSNSDIYTVWRNSTGKYILSRRSANGYSMPAYNPDLGGARVIGQTSAKLPAWVKMSFSVIKPNDVKIAQGSSFIYAQSNTPVSNLNSPSSSFSMHSLDGHIQSLDFSTISNIENRSPITSNPISQKNSINFSQTVIEKTGSNASSHSNSHNAFCEKSQTFCLYGLPNKNGDLIFTIHSASQGYAAIGIGSSMKNADVYAVWKNSKNSYTISRRTSVNHRLPAHNPNTSNIMIVPLAVPAPAWAKIQVSFQIKKDTNIGASTQYIYAYSNVPVANPDSYTSSFSIHEAYGNINGVNFMALVAQEPVFGDSDSQKALIASTPDNYYLIVQLHGVFMFLAWVVAPFLGIFIARYLKNLLGIWWYRLHLGLMLGGPGAAAMIGFLLIVLYIKPPHFDTPHAQFGLIIIITTLIQILLGFISNALWTPDRSSVPLIDKVHWWMGRVLFICGIVNVSLGISLFGELFEESQGILIGYWVFVVFGCVCLLFGEWRFGQVHHESSKDYTD